MQFEDVVRRRRMVRSFTGSPVPDATVRRLLATAVRAPTAGNTDGWAAVVLRGPGEIAPFWDATTTADWRERSRRWPGLSAAPLVLVVLANPDRYVDRYSEPDKAVSGLGRTSRSPAGATAAWPVPYWFVDAGHVVVSLLLAATDAGLGACFLGNFRGEAALLRALGVPAGWRYAGAVLAGEPGPGDHRSASLDRSPRTIDSVTHLGRW